jgi:D-beta-D-heptose 7-phosphate kinase/D-beta-D-heptose 1-phosphate adenosyltransferase
MKLKTLGELKEILSGFRGTVVFTSGCFDMLHPGHVRLLKKAKSFGDILIVAINGDNSSFFRTKGPGRPIFNELERTEILSELECVNYVIVFNEDSPLALLKELKPDIKVKGGSFIKERVEEEDRIVKSYGGISRYIDLQGNYSTSNIIKKFSGSS